MKCLSKRDPNALHLIAHTLFSVSILIAVGCLVFGCMFSGRHVPSRKQLYIPPPYLMPDSADLDLRTALAFILPNGNFGYVYFTEANNIDYAKYCMVILKKEGTTIRRIDATTKGILRYGQKRVKVPWYPYVAIPDCEYVKCGQVSILWNPPMSLYLFGGIKSVALIPFTDIQLIEDGATNRIQWTTVSIPDR